MVLPRDKPKYALPKDIIDVPDLNVKLEVFNVSAAFQLKITKPLNPELLAESCMNVHLDKKNLTFHCREYDSEVIAFRSGKMTVIKAKSRTAAYRTARIIARHIQKVMRSIEPNTKQNFNIKRFRIINIYTKFQLNFPIDLEAIERANSTRAFFDTEENAKFLLFYYKENYKYAENEYKSLIKFTRIGKVNIFGIDERVMLELAHMAVEIGEKFKINVPEPSQVNQDEELVEITDNNVTEPTCSAPGSTQSENKSILSIDDLFDENGNFIF